MTLVRHNAGIEAGTAVGIASSRQAWGWSERLVSASSAGSTSCAPAIAFTNRGGRADLEQPRRHPDRWRSPQGSPPLNSRRSLCPPQGKAALHALGPATRQGLHNIALASPHGQVQAWQPATARRGCGGCPQSPRGDFAQLRWQLVAKQSSFTLGREWLRHAKHSQR